MGDYVVYACLAMCPKCGHARGQNEKGMICRFCDTRMISVDYPADKYHTLNPKGPTHSMLIKKYIVHNPQYSNAAQKAREEKEMEEYADALRQRKLQSQQPPTPTLTTCPVCGGKVSSAAPSCPHCGQPMSNGQIEPSQTAQKPVTQQPTGPRCPTCGSANISKIGYFDRATSVAFWGLASSKIGKQYKCRSCGHKW